MPDLFKRVLVVVLAVLGLSILSRLPLAGVENGLMAEWKGEGLFFTHPSFSLGMLGLTPWFTAAVLVEMAAQLREPWRRHRAGPAGRAILERATRWVWLGAALIQGAAIALSIEQIRYGDLGLIYEPGWVFRSITTLSVVAASAAFVGLCRWSARYGLGSGLLLGLILMYVPDVFAWQTWLQMGQGAPLLPVLVVAGAVGLVTVRAPGHTTRLSAAGIMPLLFLSQAAMMLGLMGTIQLVAATVALTAVLAVVFQSPERVAKIRGVAQALVQRDLILAVLANGVFCGALVYGVLELGFPNFAVALVVIPVGLWDLVEEWQARSRGLNEDVWPIHRVYAVEPALEALEKAGIPAAVRGLRTRQLLHFFGPFVPMGVLVEAGREDEARSVLEPLLAR